MDKKKKIELKQKLTPEQYSVCVLKNTERPFSGDLLNNKKKGIYKCVVCKTPLFTSNYKYQSGSGWPSFYNALDSEYLEIKRDLSHGLDRDEISCKTCGAHLGHLFNDGPKDKGGYRFCINSVALEFEELNS